MSSDLFENVSTSHFTMPSVCGEGEFSLIKKKEIHVWILLVKLLDVRDFSLKFVLMQYVLLSQLNKESTFSTTESAVLKTVILYLAVSACLTIKAWNWYSFSLVSLFAAIKTIGSIRCLSLQIILSF